VRLPFGLGRRSSSGDGASSGSSGPASVPGSGSPASAPAGPASSRAWASLPPIQRTAGSMPQVAAPARFAAALPGTQGLPPIVQPLGHEVSPLATPGLVVARARPVEVAAAGSIPAPVQRRAARGTKTAAAVATPAVEVEVVEHAAHDAHEAPAALATAAALPIRSMPTVSRSALRVPDRPLTSAASAARPAAVQRAAAAAAASAAVGSGPLPPPAPTGMRRAPSAVVQRRDAAAPSSPAPMATPMPPPPGRSGLGEPMTSLPASARPIAAPGPVISRSTTSGPMPVAAASLRPPVQRAVAAGPQPSAAPASVAGMQAGAPAAARLPELPSLPVARQAAAAASATTTPATSAPHAAAPTAPEIRPIAGVNPIRTSVALQREAADDLDDEAEDVAALPSPWWSSSDAPTRPAAGLSGSTDLAAAPVQRSAIGVASAATASHTSPSRTAAAIEKTPHGRQAIQRVAAPASRPSPPALTLPHAPGRSSFGAPTATSDAAPPAPAIPARSVVSDPVVQTSPGRPASITAGFGAPGTPVQREGTVSVAAPTPVEPAAPGASVAPSGGGTGGGQPAQGGRHSERDLDELAMALFGRIRTRLRSDLIHDREAKGLTFDNV
jgi:hypothetical protein